LQYFKDTYKKRDTIRIGRIDTLFRQDVDMDTTIYGKRNDSIFYTLYLKLKSPNTLIVEPSFKNEKFVALSHKKETIDPPKKLFFLRWFQKKQWVLVADVRDTNPYLENPTQRFVEVVK